MSKKNIFNTSKFFIDTKNIDNTIIIAGVGRSGTTLLAETLNCNNQYRMMFEPFNKYRVKELSNMNYRLYIPYMTIDKELKDRYYKILSGDIRNQWIDQYNKKFLCFNRIIKEIRINQSLKWIKKNFPQIPIIYIIRHPCAVALSKVRLGWDDHLFEYLSQKELVDDHLKKYIEIVNSAKTNFEKHIMMWCIENLIVLKSFEKGELFILFYENLINNPKNNMKKICKYLNIQFNDDYINSLKKPSSQSNKNSAILKHKNTISDWTNYVNSKQKEYSEKKLIQFKLDDLYSIDPLPKYNDGN